ncbi:nitrous oxide reductase accessory protein NosL [Vibrio sp. 99-8-1]|uniref:nitrous oxide reductase accessory protein NosL n=1 Tax=Vibrio sp. 99-8-1 TaxID=2607602 RepID=UPI001493AF85|nr:nitrous oxide reductase accessory protein NosL [Vibrio sp. 99-8-1]NOI66089.1 nitrous oxide reductase accessory protein NosL [Vibrio sp. 99-8-1]
MNNYLRSKWHFLFALSLFLVGCGEAPQQTMLKQAVAIESADECHLCGMIIANFPGPKGEAYQNGNDNVLKFCSTRDLFSYLLQPENQRQVRQVFVHDMSKAPWQKPEDQYFIDAEKAWFVIGSSQKGAMGKTLASFGKQEDAKAFSENYGGTIYQYQDITIDIL